LAHRIRVDERFRLGLLSRDIMVRDECDIVGEYVEDIWWGRLDSKVRCIAIVQDGYLLSAYITTPLNEAHIDQSPVATQHIEGPTLGSLIHHSKRLLS